MRQPNRLFSDSDVWNNVSAFAWYSKLVLKRRLQMSRVTSRRSTCPGIADATGSSTTTLDSSGWPTVFPPTMIPAGDCKFRVLSSTSA